MGQIFRWRSRTWDISNILEDINSGQIAPARVLLGKEFSEIYAQEFLIKNGAGARISLDLLHALSKSPEELHRPIILLHVGDHEGVVAPYEGAPNDNAWAVGDGNHRVLAAGLHGRPIISFVLSPDESASYEIQDPNDEILD